jgi:PilZ domain
MGMVNSMRKQKRQFARITPQKKAFASLGETFSGICTLKDISIDGICISCISEIDPKSLGGQVNLYLPEEDVEVSSLPCKIIYQEAEAIPSSKLKDETNFKKFRCGIAFEGLDESQQGLISDFIQKIE